MIYILTDILLFYTVALLLLSLENEIENKFNLNHGNQTQPQNEQAATPKENKIKHLRKSLLTEKIWELLSELNISKIEILKLLKEKENMSFRDFLLKSDYHKDMPSSTLENHLKDLKDKGLVKNQDLFEENQKEKRNSKKIVHIYALTILGYQILELISSLEYVWNEKEYFSIHSVLDLPKRLYLGVGIMKGVIKIESHVEVHRKLVEMYNNANKFLYNILYTVEGTDEIKNALLIALKNNPNFIIKTIFGINSKIDPNRKNFLSHFELYKKQNRIKQKKIKNVKIEVVVTDNSALIFFPRVGEDHPDMDTGLFSNKDDFRLWCLDYFFHEWNNAENEIE